MYITVLDHNDGKVYQYDIGYGKLLAEDYEAWMDQKGHNISNIEWMVHEDSGVITN